MIRERVFGTDPDFCAWLRKQQKELPSYSKNIGFVASDVDLVLHRYMTAIDNIGSREIQSIMMLEVKSRNGKPHFSQLDTLYKQHFVSNRRVKLGNTLICHFGVSVLVLSGTDPSNSETMLWGRFKPSDNGKLSYREINLFQLYKLLKFELHPDNLTIQPFRRHHKTTVISMVEQMPLGFQVEKIIKQVS